METIDSVEELQNVIDFIGKFKGFVNKYGGWLANYPSFHNKESLVHASNSLVRTLWYLDELVYHHYHCSDCGLTCKLDNTSRFALRCKCGGVLWLCTYQPPSNRCNSCKERFKCLTENNNMRFTSKINKDTLQNVTDYKIIVEY